MLSTFPGLTDPSSQKKIIFTHSQSKLCHLVWIFDQRGLPSPSVFLIHRNLSLTADFRTPWQCSSRTVQNEVATWELLNNYVTCAVGSHFSTSAKEEFRAKNSRSRGSLFSMQNESTLEEKIQMGCSESCFDLLERWQKKWASWALWTKETSYGGRKKGPLETG